MPILGLQNSSLKVLSFGTVRYPQRDWIMQFHTGAHYNELCDINNPMYPDWAVIKQHIKYALIQVNARLEDDGTLTPIGSYGYPDMGVNFDQLMDYCDEIIAKGFFPIIDLWLNNFENITENGLREFLRNWSTHLGVNQVIFNPCREYNQLGEWWGDGGRTWRIVPEDFNRVMKMMRRVRDELGISNILLGSHPNIYLKGGDGYDVYGDNLYVPWIEGMRQADVLGASAYNDNVNESWSFAKHLYRLIGQTTKPFIFFEYANECWWEPYPKVTADFVNKSYVMIPSYSFVKGIIWFFGPHCEKDAIPAIGQNATHFDGH